MNIFLHHLLVVPQNVIQGVEHGQMYHVGRLIVVVEVVMKLILVVGFCGCKIVQVNANL